LSDAEKQQQQTFVNMSFGSERQEKKRKICLIYHINFYNLLHS